MGKASIKILIAGFLIILHIAIAVAKEKSTCIKFEDVEGGGLYPYNLRIIDEKLFAGGNLFNPLIPKNTEEKVIQFIKLLKSLGAKSIIALNIPLDNTYENDFIKKEAEKEGLVFYMCRMTADKVPEEKETKEIMSLIENGAYIHCNWGADRTGSIIAKYLRLKKGYSGIDAWKAVITGGSHAGKLGGLKQKPEYKKLIIYFWAEVICENKEVCRIYELKYKFP